MKSLSKAGLITLSVFVGAVFIFSAFTKLYPVEFFELAFLELNLLSWKEAPLIARFIIGVELFIGFLLLLNLKIGKWFYRFVIVLLVVFSVHLLVQIWQQGNVGNCGCFGNFFTMTPLEGILKNIALVLAVWVLLKYYQGFKLPFNKALVSLLIVTGLVLPFILNPVIMDASANMQKEMTGYPLSLHAIYEDEAKAPTVDLQKGKWIVAFLSATCQHCKIAAYKLKIIKDKDPEIPVFFVLNGDDEDLKAFYEETKSEKIPHTILLGSEFIKISGPSLPAIFMISDGIVDLKPEYSIIDQDFIEKWLQ